MHDLYIFFTPLHTTHKCGLFVEVGSLNPAVTPVDFAVVHNFVWVSGDFSWEECRYNQAMMFTGASCQFLRTIWTLSMPASCGQVKHCGWCERGKLWKTGWSQLVKNEQLNSSRPHSTDCSRLMSVSDTKNCQNGVSFKEFRSCCLETMTGWHDSFFLGGSFFGGSSLNLIIRQW